MKWLIFLLVGFGFAAKATDAHPEAEGFSSFVIMMIIWPVAAGVLLGEMLEDLKPTESEEQP